MMAVVQWVRVTGSRTKTWIYLIMKTALLSTEVLVRWPNGKDYSKWSNRNGKLTIDVGKVDAEKIRCQNLKFQW